MEKRLLNSAEAAEYCGLSVRTFRSLVRRGVLPGALKQTRRYDRVALERKLDQLSGIGPHAEQPAISAYDKWKATQHENKAGIRQHG